VSYIDPRVDPGSRTAKVRVELPNADGSLRLGMFVDVRFSGTTAGKGTIPRTAVQSIGERAVVYVVADGDETRFVERAVKLGPPSGDFVEVIQGIKSGERVVTEGSFFLRAETARTRSGG
jgi:RND family efflux transporter MFP subunit